MEKALATSKPQDMSQAMKALMLIISLEEEAVSRTLRHLDPTDIRILHQLANKEHTPDSDTLLSVYEEFLDASRMPMIPEL